MSFLALAVLAAASHAPEEDHVVVERIAGVDPPRLTIRADAAPVKRLMLAVADVAGLDATGVPADLEGFVGPISLLSVAPEDAVETLAGSIGWVGRVERNQIRLEPVPPPTDEAGRQRVLAEAIVQYEHFLAMAGDDPRAAAAWLELAALHEARNDRGRAIETLRALRDSAPLSSEAVVATVQTGRLEFDRGRWEEAMRSLVEVVEKHATHEAAPEAHVLLGRCRLAMGLPQIAERYFSRCLDQYPGTDAALAARIWRVEADRLLGRIDRAWSEIGALERLDLPPLRALQLLEVRTRAADASAWYREAAEGWLVLAAAEPDPALRIEPLERAAVAARRANDSTAELLARMASHPDATEHALGTWLLEEDLPALALERLAFDPQARFRAAMDRVRRGDLGAARHLLEQAPADGAWREIRSLIEADLALASGEAARVPHLLREVIDASQDAAFVNAALQRIGKAYLVLGDYRRAAETFRGIVPEEFEG